MKVLIDTQIVLWLLFEKNKIKQHEIDLIEDADNEIICSAISLFEISLKYSIGKLVLNKIKPDEIHRILLTGGYEVENVSIETFSTFYKLPLELHKDPFDRILIWEAITKKYVLMTHDRQMMKYEKYGLKLV